LNGQKRERLVYGSHWDENGESILDHQKKTGAKVLRSFDLIEQLEGFLKLL